MSWSFVGRQTTANTINGATTGTITLPGSVQGGDFIAIAMPNTTGGAGTTCTVAGFTALSNQITSTASSSEQFYSGYRIAAGARGSATSDTTFAITFGATAWAEFDLIVIRTTVGTGAVTYALHAQAAASTACPDAVLSPVPGAGDLTVYGYGGQNAALSGTENITGTGPTALSNFPATCPTLSGNGGVIGMGWGTGMTAPGGATSGTAIFALDFAIGVTEAATASPQVLPYIGGKAYRRRKAGRHQLLLPSRPGFNSWTADAAAAVTATGAGAGSTAKPVTGTRPVTATAAAATAAAKPVTATRPVTAGRTAAGTNAKPVTASQTVTVTRAAAATAAKPIAAARTVTATIAAAMTVAKPVTAAATVTVTRTATATDVPPSGKSIDAAQTVTVTRAAAGTSAKPVTASQPVTAGRSAATTSSKPVTGTRPITATITAAAATAKPVTGTRPVTASRAAAATSAKPVTAAQTVTAGRTAAATDTPGGKTIDAARPVTAGRAAAGTTAKPVTAVTAVTASRTAAGTGTKAAAAPRPVTVVLAATAAILPRFTIGSLTAADTQAAVLTAAGASSALTASVAPAGTLTASSAAGTGAALGLTDEAASPVADEVGAIILAEDGT